MADWFYTTGSESWLAFCLIVILLSILNGLAMARVFTYFLLFGIGAMYSVIVMQRRIMVKNGIEIEKNIFS